jgi:hypothetical protein
MRKTIMAMTAAAALLVIGGALGAVAQTDDATNEDSTAGEATDRPFRGHLVENLLDEMVADGVIDSDQATAIESWLETRRGELRAQREEMRATHEAAWEDGILTTDEAATLPFGDRLLAEDSPFADAWADGQLTQDEFDAVKAEIGPRRHHRGGLGPMWGGAAAGA